MDAVCNDRISISRREMQKSHYIKHVFYFYLFRLHLVDVSIQSVNVTRAFALHA